MFVIVKTDNRERGDDTIVSVLGVFETEAEALAINDELRANLPYEEYPIDYGVWPVEYGMVTPKEAE